MQYNPITKQLFRDNGDEIKKLYCPYQVQWEDMQVSADKVSRNCTICEQNILDTALFEEEALVKVIQQNPETCLKIDLNQENICICLDT